MHKYFIVGLLLLAATQSSVSFTDSRCQDDREGHLDNISKIRKSHKEEIESKLNNGIGTTGRLVVLSRYHSGTENSRIYKERNSEKERAGSEARTSAAVFARDSRIRAVRPNDEYTRQIRDESRRLLLNKARENGNRRTDERREDSRRISPETQRERRIQRDTSRQSLIRVLQARNERDSQSRRESHRRDVRDNRLDRSIDTGRSEDRRVNNRLVSERRNWDVERSARSAIGSERRELLNNRQRVLEERRTDVNLRREESRRTVNIRERVFEENARNRRENERFSRERNVLENRDNERRVRAVEREESRRFSDNRRTAERERTTRTRREADVVDMRQPNREVLSRRSAPPTESNRRNDDFSRRLENSRERLSARRSADEIMARRDTRRSADFVLVKSGAEARRVEEMGRSEERRIRSNERFLSAKRQNDLVKYEGGSFIAGFDVVKAVCVITLVAQMVAYGRSEKSKMSIGGIMPSFAGWLKQKVY